MNDDKDLIDAEWTTYRNCVIHPDAGPVQLQECRRAFYAGALSLYSLIIVPLRIHATAKSLEFADQLAEELNHFNEKVLGGQA